MKRFLILQLRPETDASDAEYASILDKTGLSPEQTHRIRLDCEDLPAGLDVTDYAGVIVGGGPGCVSDEPETKSALDAKIEGAVMGLMPQITAQDHPFMGCCYGLGVLAAHLGGDVSKAPVRRAGWPIILPTDRRRRIRPFDSRVDPGIRRLCRPQGSRASPT